MDVKNLQDTESRRKPGAKPRVTALVVKPAPVGEYKDRKDIGSTKARSEREQQPTKNVVPEVKQSYADKVKKNVKAFNQVKKRIGEVKKTGLRRIQIRSIQL